MVIIWVPFLFLPWRITHRAFPTSSLFLKNTNYKLYVGEIVGSYNRGNASLPQFDNRSFI
jgi:hypothetical protein